MKRLALLLLAGCSAPKPRPETITRPSLRAPATIAPGADHATRSAALFVEASRAFLSPRCVNCHPVGDSPTQGDRGAIHDPPVVRGPEDRGVPGLQCSSCHQDHNLSYARVPGAPKWQLAPKEMTWAGRTPHQLCEQIKDPQRNGGRTLAQIVDHVAHDSLVAWGWAPGWNREPAPGTQAELGAIVQAWVDEGAGCPGEEAR